MSAVEAGAGVEYKSGFLAGRPNLNPIDQATAAAHERDAIVVTLGLSGLIEGEAGAAHESAEKGDRKALELPEHQLGIAAKHMQIVDALGTRRYEPGQFTVFAGSAAPGPRAVELGAPEPLVRHLEMTER